MAYTQYIVLFRGDDTDFAGNQEIKIKLETEMSLEGVSAHFKFLDFEQDFDTIPEDKELRLVFPANVTKQFPIGSMDAELYLVDERRKRRTIANRIHIVVTQSVAEAYDNTDPQAITVSVSGVSSSVSWNNIINKPNEFPPSAHTHETSDITGLDTKLEDIEKKFDNIKVDVDQTIIQGSENPVSGGAVYNGLASKADKVPEGYGKWDERDHLTSTIEVKDGMTIGIKWTDFPYVKYCSLFPVIRNTYPPSFASAPYYMRFRYVPANQATSSMNINIILNGLLILFIDEDTGQKSNHDGVVEIVCSSAEDTNTPREFEITRYDYEGQTPVCVVRMRKI